jgi:hypothetical protein
VAEDDQLTSEGGGSQSAVVRAALVAAATGAAAYGVQRLRASRHDAADDEADETDEVDEPAADGDDQPEDGGSAGKREELTQTLTSKVAEVKKVGEKLKPSREKASPAFERARDAASPYLLSFGKEAASSLGTTVAEKAPDLVRDELMPRFIEAYEKAR